MLNDLMGLRAAQVFSVNQTTITDKQIHQHSTQLFPKPVPNDDTCHFKTVLIGKENSCSLVYMVLSLHDNVEEESAATT